MDRFGITKRIALLGIGANIVLLAAKLFIGFASASQAMIADGFNSAGDVFSSAMTYLGNRIASRPEDKTHPYGHGKAEYIFSMIISFSLVLVAYKILRNSLDSILYRESLVFSWWLMGIALFTIITKLCLFLYTRRAGIQTENLLIIANSEDHRNDVFVTSSTIIGIVLSKGGLFWADGVVGIGISLWIGFTAFKIFKSSYSVLMDTNFDEGLKSSVLKTIENIDGIDHVDSVAAKPVGIGYIVIIKVSVPGDMTVRESHGIAADIRKNVKRCKNIKDVVVHINPA